MDGRAVVELARAAVGRLGAAAPIAGAAADAFAALEKFGVGAPYTIAIAGELAARSALLDHLAGAALFDPGRREPARIAMSLKRGPATAFRARGRDGSVEERTLGATPSGALIVDESAIVDEVALIRPPRWAVWRWLAYWWRAWRHPRPAPGAARAEGARRFAERLTELAARDDIERVFVEVGGGTLPDKVVAIELPARADPKGLAAMGADACFVACGPRGLVLTRQLEAVLAILPHLFAVGPAGAPIPADPRLRRAGDAAATAPELVAIAKRERAIAVGRRALAALHAGAATLDKLLNEGDARLRARAAALEVRRVTPTADHRTALLAELQPSLAIYTARAVERALARLDAELARLATEWAARLDEATTADALRTASLALDADAPAAVQAAHATTRRDLLDELTEHAHAVCDDTLATLWGDAAGGSPPTWLALDVALAAPEVELDATASRLGSLFRSLDARKTRARSRLDARLATLRESLHTALSAATPTLTSAMTDAISRVLTPELERHRTWLDAELAVIATDRVGLADLAEVRDTARTDADALTSAVAALESELP